MPESSFGKTIAVFIVASEKLLFTFSSNLNSLNMEAPPNPQASGAAARHSGQHPASGSAHKSAHAEGLPCVMLHPVRLHWR